MSSCLIRTEILIAFLALMIANVSTAQDSFTEIEVPAVLRQRQTVHVASSGLQQAYPGSTRRLQPSPGNMQFSNPNVINRRENVYSFRTDGIPNPNQRREIRQMPIESRPYRPIHVYGNTVRRLNRR